MIKKWHIKALIQKIISYLPFRTNLNSYFQKITGRVYLNDQMFTYKITHARDHVSFYKEKYPEVTSAKTLELGTGWYPIVPITLYLSGFAKTISVDIYRWLTVENIKTTINKFIDWRNSGKLMEVLPQIDEERWNNLVEITKDNSLHSLNEICGKFNLEVMIKDAQNLDAIESNYFDFICSNNTFEHIPKVILKNILAEFKRVIKQNGVMSHHFDASDHFSHFDPSISAFHFLKFNDSQWRLINNSIAFQNRLRVNEYQLIYNELHIPCTLKKVITGSLSELKRIDLAQKYQKYASKDLAVTSGYCVSYFTQNSLTE